MKVKVMIENGVVNTVLGDKEAAEAKIDIEIVDTNSDYNDYQTLKDYSDKLYADQTLSDIPYKVADKNPESEF